MFNILFKREVKLLLNIGETYGDYKVVKHIGNNNNQIQFLVKCNICGNEKILSKSNILRQNMYHTALNCKEKYYALFVGKQYQDYKVVSIYKDKRQFKAVVECVICKHKKIIAASEIDKVTLNHSMAICKSDYCKNEIGKVYGDYKIISYNRYNNGFHYFNIECIKCKTKGVKSLLALKRSLFVHGEECFKMLNAPYKNVFEQRFNDMKQRCNNENNTNFVHYGKRNIKVEYEFLIDFYLDFIDEFISHCKIHGVKNTTFDRIDVNGNYCKENLRLATQKIQSTNTTNKRYFALKKDDEIIISDNAQEVGRKYGFNGASIANAIRENRNHACGFEILKVSKKLEDFKDMNVTTNLIVS